MSVPLKKIGKQLWVEREFVEHLVNDRGELEYRWTGKMRPPEDAERAGAEYDRLVQAELDAYHARQQEPKPAPVKVNLRKLDPKSITLRVEMHVTREFRLRMWLATRLIHLASRILNCGIEIA